MLLKPTHMRHLFTLFAFVILLASCNSVDPSRYRAYPKWQEVTEEFEAKVHTPSDKETYLDLAKKPGGWYIVRRNNRTMKTVAEYLFWSAETGKYVRVEKIDGKHPDLDYPRDAKINRNYGPEGYDRSIYFGYDGWSADVISELEGADLNDTLTESLARAYADKSMNVIRPYGKNALPFSITDEQAEEFCEWGDKEIETYRKLMELNPEYQTIVGKVDVKLANTQLYIWGDMHARGRPEASKYLENVVYNDVVLNFAKNILNGAEQNAIIFTFGDNDTYPLWYAQEKLGVRKDVAVINTSLANLPDWVYFWKKKYGFGLAMDEKTYRDSLTDFMALEDKRGSSLTFNELVAGIEKRSTDYITKSSRGEEMLHCPSKHIWLQAPNYTTPSIFAAFENSYIIKGDLFLMDIISSNYEKRPVYFCYAGGNDGLVDAMQNSLVREGLLLRVKPAAGLATDMYGDHYNVGALQKNLETNYVYGVKNVKTDDHIVRNYHVMFHALATIQFQQHDTAAAKRTLDLCREKLFPENTADPGMLVLLGDDYLAAGEKAQAEKLMAASLERIGENSKLPAYREDLQRYVTLLEAIVDRSEKNGFTGLGTKAAALKEKVEKLSEISKRAKPSLSF